MRACGGRRGGGLAFLAARRVRTPDEGGSSFLLSSGSTPASPTTKSELAAFPPDPLLSTLSWGRKRKLSTLFAFFIAYSICFIKANASKEDNGKIFSKLYLTLALNFIDPFLF